jgi:hypothetical protein
MLDEYPYDPNHFAVNYEMICPCCGIHYGYDDGGAGEIIPDDLAYSDWRFGDENHIKIMKFWRQYWISNGMKWKHQDGHSLSQKPENWNPEEQLKNLPEEFK